MPGAFCVLVAPGNGSAPGTPGIAPMAGPKRPGIPPMAGFIVPGIPLGAIAPAPIFGIPAGDAIEGAFTPIPGGTPLAPLRGTIAGASAVEPVRVAGKTVMPGAAADVPGRAGMRALPAIEALPPVVVAGAPDAEGSVIDLKNWPMRPNKDGGGAVAAPLVAD